MQDLPIIQKSYDLVKWYVPILNRLPRSHRFMLGDRIITELYNLLEGLITARYEQEKLARLLALNSKLDILRYQTRPSSRRTQSFIKHSSLFTNNPGLGSLVSLPERLPNSF